MEGTRRRRRLQNPNHNRNLNNLPEDILLHILSFFSTLEAVQTSLISKLWQTLWSRVPSCLYFSYDLFLTTKTNSDDIDDVDDGDPAEIFADSVNRAINTRRSAIRTFHLSFIYDYDYIDQVQSWIHSAVTRLHACELHLDFFIHDKYHDQEVQDRQDQDDEDEEISFACTYAFPLSLLSNGSVQVLRLTYCFLIWPAYNIGMSLGSLRSIFLDMVDLTNLSVPLLVYWCHNLEELELRNIVGVRNLWIISHRLKKVAVGYVCETKKSSCKSILIDCPNLWSIRFCDCDADRIVLKNATSVVEFAVDFSFLHGEDYHVWYKTVCLLKRARQVQKLKVTNLWFKLLTPENFFPKTFKLRNLKQLELRTGYTQYDLVGMAALLERCPNLETMVLNSINTIEEDGSLTEEVLNKSIKFKMSALKQVKLPSYSGTKDERKFVKILRAQGVAREKIVLGSR